MQEKLKTLTDAQMRLRYYRLGFYGGAIVALLLIYFMPVLGFVGSAGLIIFYLFFLRPQTKKFQISVKKAILEESFRSCLKAITYTEKNGIPKEQISKASYLPVGHEDAILIRDTLQGNYQGKPALVSDLTTDYPTFYSGGKANDRKNVGFLSGVWYEIDLGKRPGPDCIVWPRDNIGDAAEDYFFGKYEKGGLNSSLSESHTLYYTGSDRTELSEKFLHALEKLVEYTPGDVSCQISGSVVRLFIRNRFLFNAKVNPKLELSEKLLTASTPFPEINQITRVIDSLL